MIIVLLAALTSGVVSAQVSIEPLKQFSGDTLKYVKTNYAKEKQLFKEKTIGTLLADSDVDFKSVKVTFYNGKIKDIRLYYIPCNALGSTNVAAYGVNIILKIPVPEEKNSAIYTHFIGDIPILENTYVDNKKDLSGKEKELLKNLVIGSLEYAGDVYLRLD